MNIKRYLTALLMMSICCICKCGTIYGGTCGENARWTFDFDKEILTISGYGDMTDFESNEDTPWYEHKWKIEKIVIEDSITSIGSYSFNIIPHCTSVTLGNSLFSIHEKAFYYCKYIKKLVIPDNVRVIGRQAFADCSGITSIDMGENVERVETGAFSGLNNLKEVRIKSLKNWLEIHFENYSSNPLYYASNLYIDDQLTQNLVIPEGIDIVRKYSFCNVNIDTLSLPSTLSYFDVNSFINRDSIKYIFVNPLNIVFDSREDCNAIIETATNRLVFGGNISTISNSIESIGDSAFYGCKSMTNISIPETVHSIGKYSFSDCLKLEGINIPNTVKKIEVCTFSRCISLTDVNIPSSVTSIGNSAFYYCEKLKKVVLGSGITSIGNSAFSYCSSLDSLVFLSVDAPQISNNSFSNVKEDGMIICPEESDYTSLIKNLKEGSLAYQGWRLCNQKKPMLNEIWYTTTDDNIMNPNVSYWAQYNYYVSKIYPIIISNSYFNGMGVIRFDMQIPHIPDGCFKNNLTLTSVILPDSIETIYSDVFWGCKNLKSIHLPEEVSTIGDYCFSGCDSLDSLYIPSKFTKSTLYNYPFVNISNLRKVVVCEDNNTFDSRDNCNGIILTENNELVLGAAETVIPRSVKSIGAYAFQGNKSLKSLVIPDSVTKIGTGSFYDCIGLKAIEIPNSITSIGGSAFYNCDNLTSIELPNSITSIGNGAFSGCKKLVFLDLPDKCNYFPSIYDCTMLKHLTIGSNILYVHQGDIKQCNNIQSITITTKNAPGIYTSHSSDVYFYARPSGGPSVFYYPVGSNYSSWMSSLAIFNFTEDTIPERKTNELWYRTSDGEPLLLNDVFVGNVVSNGYKAGYGIIQYETPVTRIEKDAFKNCELLSSMIIPSTVEEIGDSAFAKCNNLRNMTVEWDTPIAISDNVFDRSMCNVLYVPQNTRRLYENAPGWRKFQKIVQPYNYVEWVRFETEERSIREGDTLMVKPTVFPDDAVIRDLDWYSSDETVAIVKNGMVIGKKVGTVNIKAVTKDGTLLADSCVVKVTPVLAENIMLDCQFVHMLKEHTAQLKAEVFPYRTTYNDVTWTSTDESILKVESGIITALKSGSAMVIATTTDGTSLTAQCEVKVEDYFPADVNWDSEFNIADVTGTVSFITEKNTEGLVFDAADMNKDGIVLVNDLKDVLDIVLAANTDKTTERQSARKVSSRRDGSPGLVASDYQFISSTNRNIRIGFVNADKFTGIQCDLVLPEGISLSKVSSGIDMGNHHIVTKELDDRTIRVAVYSMNNEYFCNNATDFLVLNLETESNGQDDFYIFLQNIIVSTIQSKTLRLDDITIVAKESQLTRIIDQPDPYNEGVYTNVYNLNGVEVDDNYKGIVLKKGKKVVVK